MTSAASTASVLRCCWHSLLLRQSLHAQGSGLTILNEYVGQLLTSPAACQGLQSPHEAGEDANMSLQHYRTTAFGECLVDSLDNLVTSGKISGDLAIKVLAEVRSTARPALQP